ncbi:MAG: C45 family autoproteolytic acyltransferase/hydrolase [Dehalococcoidia bacterium]
MIAAVTVGKGSHYQIGRSVGADTAPLVWANVSGFWRAVERAGHSRRWLLGKAREETGLLAPSLIDEVAGLAEGSKLTFEDLLAYNLYGGWVFPDGCTVMMAVGEAGHNGNTLFMKNSDQVGSESMVGPSFDRHKEIYVLQVIDPEEGNRIIGVSAAGRTGIKMGLNDKGVATGSNIARTIELRKRGVDISQVRAGDRTQLMRQALEKDTAVDAANLVSRLILENPMSTPGNIEFADSRGALIIEGSYTHQAMEVVRDRVAARANRFQLLEYTNQPEDVSSVCRYQRAMQLLRENEAKLTLDKFIEFSYDHGNGPGPNSICRHGNHYLEETTLGAAVIEIDRQAPERSIISIALGKPCHAWRSPEGHIQLRIDANVEEVPAGLFDGSVWKRLYTEDPYHTQ